MGLADGTYLVLEEKMASLLEKVLPWCSVINQDKYYYHEESSHHVRDIKDNLINWEVPQAFNMNQMYRDVLELQRKVRTGEILRVFYTIISNSAGTDTEEREERQAGRKFSTAVRTEDIFTNLDR